MKTVRFFFGAFLLSLLFWWLGPKPVTAVCEVRDYDNPEEYQRAIEECQVEIDARMSAHEKNKTDLAALEKNLKNTEALIAAAEKQIDELEDEIFAREIDLAYQKELLASRVRRYHIRRQKYSPLLLLLSSHNAQQLTRELAYRRMATDEDKEEIISVAQDLGDLAQDKEALEKNKASLNGVKNSLASQTTALGAEVEKVEGYFSQVEGKIAQLSAKQQALLNARAGTFTTSVGEVPVSNIPCSGPVGSPSFCDPGGGTWFAGFSFGAWTHRKGMSQYGAKGRAEAGQSYEEILQAYYGRSPVSKDTSGVISVQGLGNLDFEGFYLLGIAEMPSAWPQTALKAQAVAARSYAWRYKNEGRTICTTQACQVFSSSKASDPPPAWREAVEQTRGQVIEDVVAFYSSTSGGYLTTSGWDTTDGAGGPGFATRAWESKALSPWFYSAWFTESYLAGSAKCNRSHPWLTSEEMADILNAWQVLHDQGGDDRILPVTINQCPIAGQTGNPYSLSELRQQLAKPFTSVAGVSVVYSQAGETSSLTFETNQGPVSLNGAEFKQAFNLRAPGYIALRSPLFNVEKK